MDTEPTVICSVILYKCHRHGFKDLESSVYIAMLTLPYFWGKQPDTGCIEEKNLWKHQGYWNEEQEA